MDQNANMHNLESEKKLADLKTAVVGENFDKKSYLMQPSDSVDTGASNEYNNINFNLNDPLNCKFIKLMSSLI